MHALLPEIDPAAAYLRLVRPGLQYLLLPVVLLGVMVLVMAPGLLLVAAAGRANDMYRWLIEAFVVSLLLISPVTALLQQLSGRPLTGHAFLATVLGLALVAAFVLLVRVRRGEVPGWVVSRRHAAELSALLLIPLLFVVVLTPKFFWESFNGDGAHTYEMVRLLLFHAWPFWSDEAGNLSAWPGINGFTVAYPLSWFMRLFGAAEAGVRLPLVLFLMLLFAALRVVIETGRQQAVKPVESLFIWAAVLGYGLVMSYSATYNPYNADIALPATQDTLVMVFFLGAAGAWIRKEPVWLLVWSLLALMTSPAGVVLYAAALAGILVSQRPWRWRLSVQYGLALAGCLLVMLLLPYLLAVFGVPTPGSEHSAGMLRKFAFIALADFERFLYAFLPAGLYPVLGLLAWRGADEPGRVLTVVTVLVFAMYYFIGASSLHYFVPAMVLPIAVFWRRFSAARLGSAGLALCGIMAAGSLWLALPAGSAVYTASRDVGMRIDAHAFSSYHDMDQSAIAASDLLGSLFPSDGAVGVPDELYGDSTLAWHYYAQQPEAAGSPKAYALLPAAAGAPAGALEVARNELAAVYVLDRGQWEQDKYLQPDHSRGKPVYQIDRDVLFVRGAARERFGFFSPGIWALDLLGLDH